MRTPARRTRFESKTGFDYRSPLPTEAASRPPTLASAPSQTDAASERDVHVRARAASSVVLRDTQTMSLNRSLPARMLETLLRLVHSSENTQASAHACWMVAAEQERAKHLVGELGGARKVMDQPVEVVSPRKDPETLGYQGERITQAPR